ncbi:MAG: phosphatidate cytidylyltransferase [Gammaproteobacteria bacterium]
MTPSHWKTLFVYLGFTLAATCLALLQRRFRPKTEGESVWRKYPAYIFINLIFIFASWLPPGWHSLSILLAALGGLAAFEITRLLWARAAALAVITAILVFTAGWFSQGDWLIAWLGTLLALIAINTILGPQADFAPRTLALTGSAVYLPLCLAAYLWTWQADSDGFRVVFLYLTVATNDALAQIVGQFLGTRQLVPHISPAKTIEGALGGIIFAGLMGLALSPMLGWSFALGAAMGLAMGIAGLLGDLTASTWKRALEVRNFSSLLGTQGGVLDRFDGLIFAAPVFYLLNLLL